METKYLEVCEAVLEDTAQEFLKTFEACGVVFRAVNHEGWNVEPDDPGNVMMDEDWARMAPLLRHLYTILLSREEDEGEGMPDADLPAQPPREPMLTLAEEKPEKPSAEEYARRYPELAKLAALLTEMNEKHGLTQAHIAKMINGSPKVLTVGKSNGSVSPTALNGVKNMRWTYNPDAKRIWYPPMRVALGVAILEILEDLGFSPPKAKV